MDGWSVYPDYLLDYSCKCGACRRTCCRHDWNIVMSRREYLTNTDEDLGPDLHRIAREYMKPNPQSTGDGDYAYVEMSGDVDCPLLDESGLCLWTKLSGRYIGSTCVDFPRTCISYLDDEYLMPSGGCEAVLETLLHREAPVRMVRKPRDAADEGNPRDVAGEEKPHDAADRSYFIQITGQTVRQRPLLAFYPQLIEFGLAILQNRMFTLDERMSVLLGGLMLVDRLEDAGNLEALPEFLSSYPTQESMERQNAKMKDVKAAPWLTVFACGETFSHYACNSAHVPTVLRIAQGLGIDMKEIQGNDGVGHCVPVLYAAEVYPDKRAAFESFFERQAVFLEHVMVSLYLKMLVPVREPSVWGHAMYFAVTYAMVKGGLIGLFAPQGSSEKPSDTSQGEPSEEQLVDALVEIIRMAAHSEPMYPLTLERLKAAHLDNLQAMLALVRA